MSDLWEATDWDGVHCEISNPSKSSVTVEVWMGLDENEAEVILNKILETLNR